MIKSIKIFLIVLFAITPYAYSLDVIDKISIQFYYLSILNFASFIFNISFIERFNETLLNLFKSKLFITLLFFVIYGLITYFFAINPNEVIIGFSNWFNVLLALINLYLLVKSFKNPIKLISYLIVGTLFLELIATYYQISVIVAYEKYSFSYANKLIGLTSNKNINAASIVSKLPFLFFLIHTVKSKILRFIYFILIFLTSSALVFLSARAALISLFSVTIFYILFLLIKKLKYSIYKENLIPIVFLLLSGFFVANLYIGFNNTASINNRISTVISLNDDISATSRLKFYHQAFESFKNNPLFGVGLSNWKIESIKYDNKTMDGYIVQYHAHNDFLQNLAELGIFGFLIYVLIFIQIAILNLISFFKKNDITSFFSLSILLSLGAYFIDSNLNFPQARLVNLMLFLLLIISSIFTSNKLENENN